MNLETMSHFFDTRSSIYEQMHLNDLKGGVQSKRSLACALLPGTKTLLNLGIGTGLELSAIYSKFPNIHITGIDISGNMLSLLRKKYPDNNLTLIQQDYLEYSFDTNQYDAVISSMTMHHYSPSVKIKLYKKIKNALVEDGFYIENDYILSPIDMPNADTYEQALREDYTRLLEEQCLRKDVCYHFDTPCTLPHQIELLLEAGFADVRLIWQREHNITLAAK